MIGIFISLWNRLFGGGISYVLDEYSGAAAAYSLRKLSSTYGGSAVRVRRSFDNAEQDIGFSGGAIDETALMNFVGYQNLLQRSEEFNDAIWVKGNASISANSTTAPNGTITADTFIETAVNSFHQLTNSVTTISGQTYTFSVYAKQAAGTRFIGLQPVGSGGAGNNQTATFDLVNGTFLGNVVAPGGGSGVGTPFDSTNTSIQSVGNGWYRISCTTTVTGTSYALAIALLNSFSTAGLSYLGDGTSGVFLWGAQLNVGTSAQPYQVTTSAARSGDGFVTKWYTQDSNGENLLLQSQTFENASWVGTNFTISANTTNAPDGTLTADTITNTSAAGQLTQSLTFTSNQPNTLSFYLKYINNAWYRLSFIYSAGGGPVANAWFDIQNKVKGTTQATLSDVLSYNISDVGNGWVRVSITASTPLSYTGNYIQISTADANGSFTRVSGASAFIWGAQLSQSTWLQPYQPTTTTAILRRDASQSTAANQPRIVGGGVIERENGKAAIRFDGVDDFLNGTDIALPVWSIFSTAVQNVTNVTGYHTIYGRGTLSVSNSSRDALIYLNNVNKAVDVQRSDGTSFPTSRSYTFIQNYLVASGIYTGSQLTAFADSIAGASVSTTVTGSTNPTTLIGATAQSGTRDFYMGGEIGEVIVYNSDRTSTRADIERNLGAYYQTYWTGASSGLLDQFGGAAAAYSLRNLSSSYRGPLIRVRRSSDNAETDIGGTYNGDLDVASLLSFTGGQNLLTNSEDFSNVAWTTLRGSITSNTTIAPNGTLTADSSICNTASVGGLISFSQYIPSPSIRTETTASCYFKTGNKNFALLTIFDPVNSNGVRQYFNLTTGELATNNFFGTGVTRVGASIQNVGNGWYRCSLTVSFPPSVYIQIAIGPAIQADNVTTCSVGDFGYIWGAQLNTGILQPYIPTTTAAVNGANAFVTKWYTQDNNYQNLVLQSQTFENAYWFKLNTSVTQDVIAAPDGTLTAEKAIEAVGTNAKYLYPSSGVTVSANTYTGSVYAKAGERSRLVMGIWSGTDYQLVQFDLSNGTIVQEAAAGIASISSVGNGWYRCTVTRTVGAVTTYLSFGPHVSTNIGTLTGPFPTYTGDGNSGIYIWGAQLNEGTLVPYTATTTTVSQRRDAIQATAASQPRIVNAGGVESEGNRPALFFDGADDRLVAGTVSDFNFLHNGTSSAFVGVVKYNTAASARSIIGNNIGASNEVGYANSITSSFQSQTFIPNGAQADTLNTTSVNEIIDRSIIIDLIDADNVVPQDRSAIWVNANSTPFKNNTSTGTASTANASYPMAIGSSGLSNNIFNGDMQEVMMFSTSQNSAYNGLQSNINSYYRIYWQGNGTALLDSFSGASAAYSLRNLSSAYTGPLIRVRRSSDNVERDIYGTFGGDLDIASLVAFVGANSGFVTTWYDQSGNARNATQGTAANQPRIVNAGVVETENGKPTLFFDGSNDFFSMPNVNVNNLDWSAFHVSKNNSSITRGFEIGSNQGPYFGRSNDGNTYIQYVTGTANYYYSASDTSTTFNLRSGFARAASANFYLNGSNITLAAPISFSAVDSSFNLIGKYSISPSSNAEASELILYIGDRSSSRTAIESNINNYYKIY